VALVPFCGYLKKQSQFVRSAFCVRRTASRGLRTNLKKQTQFVQGKMGVSIYMKGSCEILCDFGRRKNKANLVVHRSVLCGLQVDSRFRGNDEKKSVLVNVNPCL
jgi:hypothetical protein